jgi:hypothetical protein
MKGESCVLALLRSNVIFRSTSIKPFYVGDIKASSDSPKHDPEYYVEGEGKSNNDTSMIPLVVSTNILLKRGRGRPYKNPNVTVFL